MKGTLKYTCTTPGQQTVKQMDKKQPHSVPTQNPSRTLLRKFSIWAEIQTKHILTEVTAYYFRQATWYQLNGSCSIHNNNYLKHKIIISHSGKQNEFFRMLNQASHNYTVLCC